MADTGALIAALTDADLEAILVGLDRPKSSYNVGNEVVRRLVKEVQERRLGIRPPVRIDPLHSVTCDYEECEADATWLVGDFYRCDDHRGTGAYGGDAG